MARWHEFAEQAPEIASAGRGLLYQYGVGLGFLATIRPDGGPRLHPFCPIQARDGLYGLIAPSPKRADLVRDGRCAIHAFPAVEADDEFFLTGTARREGDEGLLQAVREALIATGATSSGNEWLFEFDIERALFAKYRKRSEGDTWPPEYRAWVEGR